MLEMEKINFSHKVGVCENQDDFRQKQGYAPLTEETNLIPTTLLTHCSLPEYDFEWYSFSQRTT